ncbi:plexin-B1 isoform X2 [Erpetoichthys calabaricus]|uniref:plexin-B1 isoform X2 n=1 Tax=Erpetoichthys calabaricus TaxID=27687 RepID=UPI00109FB8BC|nr:plexin-B1 isoform X2 [Erpetoichthys calabaricus]
MFIMPPGIIIVSAALCVLCRAVMTEYESFTREGVTFEHLVLHPDPQVGMVYVGAKNHLFQLTADLRLRIEEKTGPVRDNKECLPPITDSNCPQARDTNNHNKLLLVNLYSQELITCGSVYQGICEKRSLESIKTVTFRTIRPVDTQYVAANDPNVTTVGLVVLSKDHLPVVFVGRGYTSSHPPISTRNLKSPPIFSYEETAKLAVAGRLSEYDHHFVKSFSHQSSVYFLFYRRDLKSQSREYKTYISRICLDDVSYYSYVEVPLVCQAQGKKYNLLQAAHVGQPGDDLAGRQVTTRGFMLFGVFSTWQTTLSKPGEESALCMYTLEEIDRRINETQDACYTQEGRSKTGTEAAYIEYDVKSNCANLPSNTLEAFPCGSDHTPTPMASRIPVEATPVFDSPQARLTAVAVTVLDKHTIAFLGDSQGNLNKIFLPPSGVANKYSTLLIQKNGPINSDLLLDEFQEFLYIMTPSMVVRQPVAECSKHLDCQSCLATNDPYCGWCVLKGRCGRRSECRRSESPGQWLWSYDQQQQCLTVQSLSPSNISREEKRNIFLSIPKLPTLGEEESYSCFFEDYESLAVITETGATCSSPDANKVPPIGQGLDHVNVTLSLRFLNITVTSIKFTFYDCSAVKQLSRNMPCQACVKSQWGCHWCVHQHLCTHKPTCEEGTIIYNEHGLDADPVSQGPEECPCVEKVQGSSLLPVNTKREITLVGRNLHLFQDPDYTCVFVIEGQMVMVDALVKTADEPLVYYIMCQPYQYTYSAPQEEYNATVYIKRRDTYLVDSSQDLYVTLYNCSVGRSDCSRCHTADSRYSCVWCGGEQSSCIYSESCTREIEQTCPAPVIDSIDPLSGLVEGGTTVTITGSNLGQKFQDVEHTVSVAGMRCTVDPQRYEISTRIVCITTASDGPKSGQVSVEVNGGGHGGSTQVFTYQDPVLDSITPLRGPKAGGTNLTIRGAKLLTGRPSEISILVGDIPCAISSMLHEDKIECLTGKSNATAEATVTIHYGQKERHLQNTFYHYTEDPNITQAGPSRSFLCGGRMIHVFGNNLDVVQQPKIQVTISPKESWRTRRATLLSRLLKRHRRIVPDARYPQNTECFDQQFIETCTVNSSSLILCKTPAIDSVPQNAEVKLEFIMDNLRFDFNSVSQTSFSYEDNPVLKNLSDSSKPYRHKPGSVISVEGDNLDLAISKEEVLALIGDGVCAVKTLSRNHLYCEPPLEQPSPRGRKKRDISDSLPEFIVFMGNLKFTLGKVQYDTPSPSTFPLEAQIGVGVGASIVALIVLIIVLVYRRKSKQALRDYKKVQIQLENLETSVRDRCKKEFTDLMTEMMDMSSDLVGTGIPFLDYKMYAERIFFPGHRESPLRRDLDVQDCRRQTVEQGLVQLSNLLNSKLFLTKFIYTLECQRTFSPRDRAYVASLLTVSLHGKLEYFTDILKTLLNDLVEQYVAKNPKLMLRRTETVVEKLLTNWMSICLYAFLRDFAGESLYMLFRAIKHQVDKGPVDAVTGKAKYTLNDNRLLREDVEYRTLTLNVLMQGAGNDSQPMQTKALDCDTITQVKEKVLDQVYKGTSYSHRPHTDSLDLEWRSGVAGHLILSDEDLTSVVQGSWKRLNTLQHYKVPDGATVALVPRNSKHIHHENHDYMAGEKTPMLEDADEGGIKLWHLVKASEEPELPKHRRGSLRERERAKAIPEIYLTRLLSMKGTLQKFVDDLFQVILSTSRPVPLAVKYFFDLLDDQAVNHGISDPETIHIWKTNSLPLRFWINIIKNPQFIFDVQASDNVDAVLSVIAQTFMDSCTIAEHKLGRDSPINKLLYARDIPRYKQMVERYYADIRQTISASDQEMNSALAELSRNYSGELNYLVALHELYKYINKYYDQIITALEEDPTAQKMQLGYRLQQIAAAVENKVTDL